MGRGSDVKPKQRITRSRQLCEIEKVQRHRDPVLSGPSSGDSDVLIESIRATACDARRRKRRQAFETEHLTENIPSIKRLNDP